MFAFLALASTSGLAKVAGVGIVAVGVGSRAGVSIGVVGVVIIAVGVGSWVGVSIGAVETGIIAVGLG